MGADFENPDVGELGTAGAFAGEGPCGATIRHVFRG
jgi:hypothetical protein